MPETANKTNQIVYTNTAKCMDCNLCIRVCPVKAIKMKDGQAQVEPERCIVCGTCIKMCPQKAKTYRNDLQKVKDLMDMQRKVAAIIAPSFPAVFTGWKAHRIASALRQLGFNYIAEASLTAGMISNATQAYIDRNKSRSIIASACPAVVNYVERYKPELLNNLAPIVSPMIATARVLKDKLGYDWDIVFIGPCTAKKMEAERPEYAGLIRAVLTFEELQEWFMETNVNLAGFEDSGFDLVATKEEKVFALSGGVIKATGRQPDAFSGEEQNISGFESIEECFKAVIAKDNRYAVEPLMCNFGCINGPAIGSEDNLFLRKKNLIEYADTMALSTGSNEYIVDLNENFSDNKTIVIPYFSEDEIQRTLELIGKSNPEDRLDCTSCGYPSCKDKAIAVLCGMAQPSMCVPFIRKIAESKTDSYIEFSPNGIVVLNEKYEIVLMNKAFKNMFLCTNSLIGKPISTLMDPEPFLKVGISAMDFFDTTIRHNNYNLICQQIIYPLKQEKQIVGIFVNLTNTILNKERIDEIKQQTVQKATRLLTHQIDMAQKIAKLLGDSTAEGEELVNSLLNIADGNEPSSQSRNL